MGQKKKKLILNNPDKPLVSHIVIMAYVLANNLKKIKNRSNIH